MSESIKNKTFRILSFKNPYTEGSQCWHCFIDLCQSANDSTGLVKVSRMIQEHNQTEEYYETYLSQLIEDNIIEVVNE